MVEPRAALPAYSAVLLAGGQGSRMGGDDKGWQALAGQPLVRHVLQRLQAQSLPPKHLLISANRHLADYRALGVPTHPDREAGFVGPLAGFATGLRHARTPWLLTAPCDVPLLPLDLAERLMRAALQQQADIAMAALPQADGTLRREPVLCLLHTRLRPSLQAFLQAGGRQVGAWAAQHRLTLVAFDQAGDTLRSFSNLNTPAQLQALESQLAAQPLQANRPAPFD